MINIHFSIAVATLGIGLNNGAMFILGTILVIISQIQILSENKKTDAQLKRLENASESLFKALDEHKPTKTLKVKSTTPKEYKVKINKK